jgi:hypothetical protein
MEVPNIIIVTDTTINRLAGVMWSLRDPIDTVPLHRSARKWDIPNTWLMVNVMGAAAKKCWRLQGEIVGA